MCMPKNHQLDAIAVENRLNNVLLPSDMVQIGQQYCSALVH